MRLRERFNVASLAMAGIVAAITVLAALAGDPLDADATLASALVVFALLVSSIRSVRGHDLYPLASVVTFTGLIAVWGSVTDESSLVFGAVVALGVVGSVVELYNYRYGTSYFRLDR